MKQIFQFVASIIFGCILVHSCASDSLEGFENNPEETTEEVEDTLNYEIEDSLGLAAIDSTDLVIDSTDLVIDSTDLVIDSTEVINNIPEDCDVNEMSYIFNILPIINSNCISCHNNSISLGGINFMVFSELQEAALNESLLGAVQHSPDFMPMPHNGVQLSECEIAQIESWVLQGASNN